MRERKSTGAAKGTAPLATPGISAFHTRRIASEGRKLFLHTPTGEKTAHYIIVRGTDSDEYHFARAKANRKTAEFAAIENEDARQEAIEEEIRALRSACVAGWSFDDPDVTPQGSENWTPCTREKVIEFFREAPQIAEMVDRFASRRANFFGKPLGD